MLSRPSKPKLHLDDLSQLTPNTSRRRSRESSSPMNRKSRSQTKTRTPRHNHEYLKEHFARVNGYSAFQIQGVTHFKSKDAPSGSKSLHLVNPAMVQSLRKIAVETSLLLKRNLQRSLHLEASLFWRNELTRKAGDRALAVEGFNAGGAVTHLERISKSTGN